MKLSIPLLLALSLSTTNASTFRRRAQDFPTAAPVVGLDVPTEGTDAPSDELSAVPPGQDGFGDSLGETPTQAPAVGRVDELPSSSAATQGPTPDPFGEGLSTPTQPPVDDIDAVPVPSPFEDGLNETTLEPTVEPPTEPTIVATISPAPVSSPTGVFPTPTEAVPSAFEPTMPVATSPTFAPVRPAFPTSIWEPPTDSPMVYVPSDDDPLQQPTVDDTFGWNDSTLDEIEHDRTVLIALSVVFGVGVCLAIFTAQQVLENPNGCCSRYV